jgi:hypothetical protein
MCPRKAEKGRKGRAKKKRMNDSLSEVDPYLLP